MLNFCVLLLGYDRASSLMAGNMATKCRYFYDDFSVALSM